MKFNDFITCDLGKLAKSLCSSILLSVANENQCYLVRDISVIKWDAICRDRIAPDMQKSPW